MTKADAKVILKAIIPIHSARLDGELENGGIVDWHPNDFRATLDGEFSWDELEALAVWMRSEYDPTRE